MPHNPQNSNLRAGRAPVGAARATAIVSVGAVLLILGVVTLIGVAMARASLEVRRGVGFTVIMSDLAAPEDINSMNHRLRTAEYASHVEYSNAETVKSRWQEMVGPEEPLDDLLDGANPFLPEFDVRVTPAYADPESLTEITAPLQALPQVEHVRVSTEIARRINTTLRDGALILGVVTIVLLAISLMLINNTVRLAIYSRRHLIYTMRLVGATGGFIRRPIVGSFAIAGAAAGVVAAALLAGGVAWLLNSAGAMASVLLPWSSAWPVFVALPVVGVLICAPTAAFAVNRWLRRDEDGIYK